MITPETTIADVDRDIVEEMARMREDRTPVEWVVQAVCARHSDIGGTDADYAIFCMYNTVQQQTNKYVRRIKKAEQDSEDELLPGFDTLPGYERLQKQYIIESTIVSIDLMTGEEFDRKIAEHQKMGAGNFKHADELARYKEERKVKTA